MTDPMPELSEVHQALQESPEERQKRISDLYTQFDPHQKGKKGSCQLFFFTCKTLSSMLSFRVFLWEVFWVFFSFGLFGAVFAVAQS